MVNKYHNLPLEPGGNVFGPSGGGSRTVQSAADVRETKAYNKESTRRKKMIGNYGKYGGDK